MARTSPWQDGRRAWERLNGWHKGTLEKYQSPTPTQRDPLKALADARFIRDQLAKAELNMVTVARREGKTWVEIGTALGMTRQAAWEKWHELDDGGESPVGEPLGGPPPPPRPR